MTRIERDGETFVIPSALLAEAFRMTEDAVRLAMRDGSLTSRCETGEGDDAGHWRLTFRHEGRACRFTFDETGVILKSSRYPVRPVSS